MHLTSLTNVFEYSKEEHLATESWNTNKSTSDFTSALKFINSSNTWTVDEFTNDFATHGFSSTRTEHSKEVEPETYTTLLIRYLTANATSAENDASLSRQAVLDTTEGKTLETQPYTFTGMINVTEKTPEFEKDDSFKRVTLLEKLTYGSETTMLNKTLASAHPSKDHVKGISQKITLEPLRHSSTLISDTTQFKDEQPQKERMPGGKPITENKTLDTDIKSKKSEGEATTLVLYIINKDDIGDETSEEGEKHISSATTASKRAALGTETMFRDNRSSHIVRINTETSDTYTGTSILYGFNYNLLYIEHFTFIYYMCTWSTVNILFYVFDFTFTDYYFNFSTCILIDMVA